jgi:tetratricopeptide (TPR) repeat protein
MASADLAVEAIRKALRLDDLDLARRTLEEARSTFAGDVRLILLAGQIQTRLGNVDAAREIYRNLAQESPDNPAPLIRLAHLAIDAGEFESAGDLIRQALERGASDSNILDLRLALARSSNDVDTERALLTEALASLEAPRAAYFLRLGILQLNSGHGADALAVIEAGLVQYPDDIRLLRLGCRCAMEVVDTEKALAFCIRLIDEDAANLKWPTDLARLYRHQGATDSAIEMVRSRIDNGKAGAGIYLMASHLPLPADLKQTLVSWATGIEDASPTIERKAAAIILARLGMESDLAISKDDINPQLKQHLQTKRSILAKAPADAALLRPLVVDDSKEILVAEAPSSTTTLLVFTGLADRTGMPIALLDRYLATLDISVVYLRDFSRFLFNKGVLSVASDYPESIRYLENLVGGLGTTQLMTLGSSAGSFAAIRYGVEMGAVNILGFSAPTNISADFLDRIEDRRGKIVARRLQTLPPECRDLKPIIRQAQARSPIHLFSGEQMPVDCRHVQHVAKEPGVTLHPISGVSEHNSLGVLAENEQLLPLLREYLLGSTSNQA